MMPIDSQNKREKLMLLPFLVLKFAEGKANSQQITANS